MAQIQVTQQEVINDLLKQIGELSYQLAFQRSIGAKQSAQLAEANKPKENSVEQQEQTA